MADSIPGPRQAGPGPGPSAANPRGLAVGLRAGIDSTTMSTNIRWGIISTGRIAHKFAQATKLLPDAELVAVGSRSQEAAEVFGKEFGVPRCHGSYEDLVADPEVDAVYVATPHPFHLPNTVLALEAGKHVLCEKPLTVNAGEAAEVIRVARTKGLFLMEAMWTRFLPVWVDLKARLDSGEFGEIAHLQANFGVPMPADEARIHEPGLAGGACSTSDLPDLAGLVVPREAGQDLVGGHDDEDPCRRAHHDAVQLCRRVVRHAEQRHRRLDDLRSGDRRREGLDPRAALLGGPVVRDRDPGRKGRRDEALRERVPVPDLPLDEPHPEGQTESEVMSLDESLEIMKTMDSLRAEWGFKYPFE